MNFVTFAVDNRSNQMFVSFNKKDELPKNNIKQSHRYGTTAKVSIHFTNNNYTGLFQESNLNK